MPDAGVARMRPFATTIFAEMTELAHRHGAVNLGQGFPDTDGPDSLLAAAAAAITGGGYNQYAPGPGLAALRAAIAAERAARYGLVHDPDREVLVTVGATEGVTAAILGLVEPGAEVLVLEPCYDSYPAAAALAGARLRPVRLRWDGRRFALDPGEFAAAVTPATRAVLVNSPHNPTGTVLTPAELAGIAALCQEHDLIAITDEVYEYLTYDGAVHRPLATLPGMAERTLSVSSAGKTFAVTGWKIGWVCGPAPLVAAVARVKQFLAFTAGGPFQAALAAALTGELGWVAAQCRRLQDRRDQLVTGLSALGAGPLAPQAGYFVQADARALGYPDGLTAARALPAAAGVAVVPTSVFYLSPDRPEHLVRLAFCKTEPVLAEALHRLAAHAGRSS